MDLTAHHHEEQKHIARTVVLELGQVWLLLDFHNLKETTPPWLKAARPIVESGRMRSAGAAAEYVSSYRANTVEAEEMDFRPPELTKRDRLKITASLTVTGPVWLAQHSQPGMEVTDIPDLMRRGFSKVSGSVVRMVLNGGRSMVRDAVMGDSLARGIVAVTDQDACNGCQFLTNPIPKSAGAKRINAVAVGHDFCTCSAKPIY